MSPAVPLLPLASACIAEARRALLADALLGAVIDDAFVIRLLVIARALPVAIDALAADAETFGRVRIGSPQVEGALAPSNEALAAVASVDEAKKHLEVRITGGPVPDKLVGSDAPVLCRVVFPLVFDEPGEDGGKVLIQRFGQGPTQRR